MKREMLGMACGRFEAFYEFKGGEGTTRTGSPILAKDCCEISMPRFFRRASPWLNIFVRKAARLPEFLACAETRAEDFLDLVAG
jgi:hypothetical protein